MFGTPYDSLPSMQRWSSFADDLSKGFIDVQGQARFTIANDESIASAGSCFAARLAERLRADGSNYLIAEPHPSWLSAEQAAAYGYVPFSARYGLVYNTLQLLQLFERAFGTFVPKELFWERNDRFFDPFRPRCTPTGYATVNELVADRDEHLAAVRTMFRNADVFLFTMGLIELWRDRRDGAVFPYCPGMLAGTYDEHRYEYHMLDVSANVEAMNRFVRSLRNVNPEVRVILSVSPVPLGATMERQHVVRSTTYAKSVLRVAAEEMRLAHEFVDYFSAYEMVSQSFFGRDPFTQDRRHLKPGVADDVVRVFRKHYLQESEPVEDVAAESVIVRDEIACDEDLLAR